MTRKKSTPTPGPPLVDKAKLQIGDTVTLEGVTYTWTGEQFEVPSPLSSPQHRRHLREAARLELREWEAKWLRMGTDPESLAEALEGRRVECMAEARRRGRQG